MDVLVQDGGGELEEGERNLSRLCERGGGAESKDVILDFEREIGKGK